MTNSRLTVPPSEPTTVRKVLDLSVDADRPTKQQYAAALGPSDTFVRRHVGPDENDIREMLKVVGYETLDELIDATIPASIRLRKPLTLLHTNDARGEFETLQELRAIAAKNKVYRSFIGMGYYDTITPPVIQRNILENPGWYTQYTPYQAEIAQGRLEALLNFQTMVSDLVGLPVANASLLDEATAAAEAMAMCFSIAGGAKTKFFVADDCHPQTIEVVRTRAASMGIDLHIGKAEGWPSLGFTGVCGALVQYPTTDGRIVDFSKIVEAAHAAGALVVYATDLLACTLIKPPGEWGADIAVGSAQRFGVPMGFGGPHAAFMATKNEFVRKMPGRLIGVSKDAHGNLAYRMAIQTREQHIKRERATSNICTAQVLLAIMASMYAVYHGPEGLKKIARRVHDFARLFADTVKKAGGEVHSNAFFDTVRFTPANDFAKAIANRGCNVRRFDDGSIGVSFDETTTETDFELLCAALGEHNDRSTLNRQSSIVNRQSPFLTHPVFNTHHSETEMLRYITKLQSRDLSLANSMIALGSCTMKLNATSEMIPVTWPEFGRIHPFAPADQWQGYAEMFKRLEDWLAEITGFAAVSLQPNAGSQGEYAGLLAIRAYHESRGEGKRNICLIPVSAHGTNPASAVIAGYKVVAVACDRFGNIDLHDLRKKAEEHRDDLAALMITYPSTHGVYEPNVKEVIAAMHEFGGQVYMDGANMNAQVGLTSPGFIGADVCHLNLHKTFCIPHGGGGPGMGPIGVAKHLVPFLPRHPLLPSPPGRGAGGEGASESKPPLDPQVRDFVRTLRSQQTDAESLLWQLLRDRRLGVKFRRQHPLDPYVLDFYCHEALLAIELDGGQHNEATGRARDEYRTTSLSEKGIRVVRFWNQDVLTNTEAVLEAIWNAVHALTPDPSPGGRGESFGSAGAVSAAPYGSASILPISYMYIAMMGAAGLTHATKVAILSANYMAKRLEGHYRTLFTNENGLVAHEFIADCREFDDHADVKVEDIAKRLMDYGFHAPTMSFPVPGTLMIEPTESEPKAELDRFCEALILIREEIRAIEEGRADRKDNVLKNAPHTIAAVSANQWNHAYTREQAAFPAAWLREHKFWPSVGRIDNPYGDRNLMCTCPPMEGL